MQTSAALPEGGVETRSCGELQPDLPGTWQARCHEGSWCVDSGDCAPHLSLPPEAVFKRGTQESQASASKTQLEDEANVTEEDEEDEEELVTKGRRLTCALLDSRPDEVIWDEICALVERIPYVTVAGGRLAGSGTLQLDSQRGIYVSPITNDIYVADWANHRIQRWRPSDGTAITVAGITGTSGNALNMFTLFNPSDIVIQGQSAGNVCGEMFIADEANSRIVRWPADSDRGFLVAGFTGGDPETEQFKSPSGLWVMENLDVYVADRFNHRVVMWSRVTGKVEWIYNTTIAGTFEVFGNTLSLLAFPTDVAVDPVTRDVYVADFGNDRVLKFTSGSSVGELVGTCFAPFSVFLDSEGIVYAACQTIHCIRTWQYTGGLWVVGQEATGDCGFFVSAPHIDHPDYPSTVNQFFSPSAVFVDPVGNIFVSDTTNNRIIKRGRGPLSQWIVANSETVDFEFTFSNLAFYQDLACTDLIPVKASIATGDYSDPWTPPCTASGGRCLALEAWIGREFFAPKAVRCVRVTLTYSNPDPMRISLRYWGGTSFDLFYDFGDITSGQEWLLRYPRFDDTTPKCVKGERECTISVVGDWQTDDDRVMIKSQACSATSALRGIPNNGRSDRATVSGTQFVLGDVNVDETITADASAGNNYKICWCDSRLSLCEVPVHFQIEATDLIVDGPFETQTHSIARGMQLIINGVLGVGLLAGDQLLVVSGDCGPAASDVVGIPRPAGSLWGISEESVDGSTYSWGEDWVSASPTDYVMCWCRQSLRGVCQINSDFLAAAGALSVTGPDSDQTFVCINGDPCSIDVNGRDFEIGDNAMVLARCGEGVLQLPPVQSTTEGTRSTYSWGEEGIQVVVGIKRLCWCSLQANCGEDVSNYRVEVGIFTVLGPDTTLITCGIGVACGVTGITGLGLDISRRLLVTEGTVCGMNTSIPLPGFPGEWPGISFDATDGGTSFFFGTIDHATVQPGQYTVCWCHAGGSTPATCDDPMDFRVKLADLTVRGPYVLPDALVCGTNSQCSIKIEGWELRAGDSLLIKEGDCETGNYTGRNFSVLESKSITELGTDHRWEPQFVPEGGNYNLCWCYFIQPEHPCDTLEDFIVPVGQLLISSPREDNSQTCISGGVCNVTILGFGLQTLNKIAVIEGGPDASCGSDLSVSVEGIPGDAISSNTSVSDDKEVAVFNLDNGDSSRVTTLGGAFVMCWCPGPACATLAAYRFSTGVLSIAGPSNPLLGSDGLFDFTCWNGQVCRVTGVDGQTLSDGDRIRLATSCVVESLVGGMPNQGISDGANNSGTSFAWGNQNITSVIVGVYRMCWCSHLRACEFYLDFVTDFGTMTIGGPKAGQTRECKSGNPCALDNITGFALGQYDLIVLQSTCGRGLPINNTDPDFNGPWYQWPPFRAESVYNSGLKADFLAEGTTEFIMTANPGNYRMCWCSASTQSCPAVENFGIDIGIFVNVGAAAGQSFWCAPGFTCRLLDIQGVSLEDGDQYLVTSGECSETDPPPGFPDEGRAQPAQSLGKEIEWAQELRTDTLPRDYRLCWCRSDVECTMDLFRTGVGVLAIVGPTLVTGDEWRCSVGSVCQVDNIQGHQLQTGDRLLVVTGDCGENAQLVDRFPNSGMSSGATSEGRSYRFDMLVNTPSGSYNLCWCAASRTAQNAPFTCTDPSDPSLPVIKDFRVHLGTLFIPEVPAAGQNSNRTCLSGLPCVVDNFVGSTGGDIPASSTISVRVPDGTITDATTCEGSVQLDQFPNDGVSDPATSTGEYNWGNNTAIWAQGFEYIMCWKSPQADTYQYRLGILTVLGPTGGQSFNCTQNAPCRLQGILGNDVADQDWFRVMEESTCASQAVDNAEAESFTTSNIFPVSVQMLNSIVEWPDRFGPTPQSVAKGLCWCHRSLNCNLAEDFRVYVGALMVFGPFPGQNKQCDRGQACDIMGIRGVNLQPHDFMQVLVECGTGPRVGGFSPPTADAQLDGADTIKFNWPYVTSSPGIFRMCWCEASECAAPQWEDKLISFDVEVGIITIQGPIEKDMVAGDAALYGRRWEFELPGVNLGKSTSGRLRVMWECPTNVSIGIRVPTFPYEALPNDTSGRSYFFDQQNLFQIQPANFTVETQTWTTLEYKLCWCRGPTDLDPNDDCDTINKFATTIGTVHVVCPQGQEPFDKACIDCPVGKYKDTDSNSLCITCPSEFAENQERWTTPGEATIFQYMCNCKPGYWYQATTRTCEPCEAGDFCLGGFSNLGEVPDGTPPTHTAPQLCPPNSGSWDRADCPVEECTGNFPAQTRLDCSCVMGYEARPGLSESCEPCEVDKFKPRDGNSTVCTPCRDSFKDSSTVNLEGAFACSCQDGLYMVTDEATQQPLFCATCPQGFFCTGSELNNCPENTSTIAVNTQTKDDCFCAAGFFRNSADECEPCAAGATVFKSTIGNEPCSEPCPANSRVPDNILGAKGPENCICDEGYVREWDEQTFALSCVVGVEEGLRTTVRLTAAIAEATFEYVPLSWIPELEAQDSNSLIKRTFAAQLGLTNNDQVIITVLEVLDTLPRPGMEADAAIAAAPLFNTTTSTTAPIRRLGDGLILFDDFEPIKRDRRLNASVFNETFYNTTHMAKLRVQLTVWQSTFQETTAVRDRVIGVDTNQTATTLRNGGAEVYENLQVIYFNPESISIAFHFEDCPPNSAVLPGATYIDKTSCKCIPGYQANNNNGVPLSQEELIACTGTNITTGHECIPCCRFGPRGMYKDWIGNEPCVACPFVNGEVIFPETFPLFGANSTDHCICSPGLYRVRGILGCDACPFGSYCDGRPDPTNCPDNEWTQKNGQSSNESCVCSEGYFRSLDVKDNDACIPCDETYYKSDLGDGNGRCTARCDQHFGSKSTSPRAATSVDACVCEVNAYMRNSLLEGDRCESCPLEGVRCPGGKVNVTNGSSWSLVHAPPVARENYFMLNVFDALVAECRVQTPDGPVCRGDGEGCETGHTGFLCGACAPMWTRDKFPEHCSPCSDMPGDPILFGTIMGQFTLQAGWNLFLAVSALQKTETQKNVMTVLLRMLTHWFAQLGVLGQTNLSKMRPLNEETQEDNYEEIEEEDTTNVNASNSTLSGEEVFAWPGWFGGAMENTMFLQELVGTLGSQQQIMECVVARNIDPTTDGGKEMKLIIPAMWWLLYPVTLVLWTIFLAMIVQFVFIPVYVFIITPKDKRKKQARKQKRREEKARRMRKQLEREARRLKEQKENPDKYMQEQMALTDSDGHQEGQLPKKKEEEKKQEDWERFSYDSEDEMSDSDSEEEDFADSIYVPEMMQLGDELDASVVNPPRFSYTYVPKEAVKNEDDNRGKFKKRETERIAAIFRPRPKLNKHFLDDILPWLVITLNNVWNTVTNRMLLLLLCVNYKWNGTETPTRGTTVEEAPFLMMNPDVQCYTFTTVHGQLMIISFLGLTFWSIGIVATIFWIIRGRDRQKTFVTRNFGYLLEGFEPNYWFWELSVKKADLFFTAVFSTTSIAGDERAKILLYSVQAAIAFAVQLWIEPYDNRQLSLLDSMEALGLFVRECVFTGVAFTLLFGTPNSVTLLISVTLFILVLQFLVSMAIHMADDFLTTQAAVNYQKKIKKHLDNKTKLIKLRRRQGNHQPVKDEDVKQDPILKARLVALKSLQSHLFAGGWAKGGYRDAQLLRFMWSGPGSDAIMHMPSIWEGTPPKYKRTFVRYARLALCKAFYGINDYRQLNSLSRIISDFVSLLLTLAKFNQFPGRLTDLIFFLSHGVKRMKHDMENHPNAARPPPQQMNPKVKLMCRHFTIDHKTCTKLHNALMNAGRIDRVDTDVVTLWIVLKRASEGTKKVQDVALHVIKQIERQQFNEEDLLDPKDKAEAAREIEQTMTRMEEEEEPPAKPNSFSSVELLKMSLLQELFQHLMGLTREKRNLIDIARASRLADVLQQLKMPHMAAWDILDKLTNDQLHRVAVHPTEICRRVNFNLILSSCTDMAYRENIRENIQRVVDDNKHEKEVRKSIYKYFQFHLRERLEQDPDLDMDWRNVVQVLNTLPVVELDRLVHELELHHDKQVSAYQTQIERAGMGYSDPVIDLVKTLYDDSKRRDAGETLDDHDDKGVLTVEDLNSMLMFLQKLPYDELHLVIEWTQLLIDFRSLPTNAAWRDAVVHRGSREVEDPSYYRNIFDLRQRLREQTSTFSFAEKPGNEDDKKKGDVNAVVAESRRRLFEHQRMQLELLEKVEAEEVRLRELLGPEADPAVGIADMEQPQEDDLESLDSAIPMPVTDAPPRDVLAPLPAGHAEQPQRSDPLWRRIESLKRRVGAGNLTNAEAQFDRRIEGMRRQIMDGGRPSTGPAPNTLAARGAVRERSEDLQSSNLSELSGMSGVNSEDLVTNQSLDPGESFMDVGDEEDSESAPRDDYDDSEYSPTPGGRLEATI